jgi:adenylate kinase
VVHVILMGAQGSGKGTQAALLGPQLKLTKIATGDLFRAEIASGSPLGLQLKDILDRGDLVPDDLTNAIVRGWIAQIIDRRQRGEDVSGVLFDGFPRTDSQARALDELLASFGESVTAVVEIDVPRDELVQRLSGRRMCPNCGAVFHIEANPTRITGVCDNCGGELIQRDDDQPAAIARRLALYDQQTAPLLGHYEAQGKLVRVDGDQDIETVQASIIEAIDRQLARSKA